MGSLMLCHCLHPYLNILSPRFGVLTRWPWSGFRTGRSFLIGSKAPSRLLHIHVIPGPCDPPSHSPLQVLWSGLCLLHCARVATTVGPASDTSSEGRNSDALDALLDQPLLDEALDMGVELDDELLLELELELELELLSAAGTTTSVGVRTAGMGISVSLCIASCPRRPVPKHLTTAARFSSLTMKYGGAIMGCAACMWLCRAYVHNHLVHDFTGHAVGTFVHGLHFEPLAALLTCSFVYATRQLLWTLPLCVKVVWHNLRHDPQKKQKLDASVPSSPSHRCPNKKRTATCVRMPTNRKRCWHRGNEHTAMVQSVDCVECEPLTPTQGPPSPAPSSTPSRESLTPTQGPPSPAPSSTPSRSNTPPPPNALQGRKNGQH